MVPQPLKVTHDQKPFLILDKVVDAVQSDKKILGFASPSGIEIMRQSREWYTDGTFKICKYSLCKQIFVIIARAAVGITVPCAFFMLPDKEIPTYCVLYNALKDLNLGPDINYCDYEPAQHAAVRQVYSEVDIRGCDVHWKRSLRSNLSKHHVLDLYNSDTSFQLCMPSFGSIFGTN